MAGVLNFLEKNKHQNFYLIEEHETDAKRARDYVAKESIENVEILSVASLRGRYLNRPVLIPFLFSNSVIDVLSSASIAVELKLFFGNFEFEVFKQRKKRTDRALSVYKWQPKRALKARSLRRCL